MSTGWKRLLGVILLTVSSWLVAFPYNCTTMILGVGVMVVSIVLILRA